MAKPASVALVQTGTDPIDTNKNRAALICHAENAFKSGADIVVLPEMSVPGYTTRMDYLLDASETLHGPTTQGWQDLAATYDGFVVGGFCESHEGELFNTAALVGGDRILLHYRKLHLFAEEKKVFSRGNMGLPLVATRIGNIGLCVCYDLRFVEVARAYALRGVELLCVPTAWVSGFDTIKWNRDGLCPQAQGAALQANLNQMFIACASQVGQHGEHEFLGSSMLADPAGEIVAGPLSIHHDEIAVTVIDLEAVEKAQERNGLIKPRQDRRSDVYGISFEGTIL